MKLESLPVRLVEVSVSACRASSAEGAVESEPKPRESNTPEALVEVLGDDEDAEAANN